MTDERQQPSSAEQFTVEQVADAIRRAQGVITIAARTLGCHRNTVHNYIKRYRELEAVVEDSSEEILDMAEGQLITQVGTGEPWAVKFLLATKGAKRGYARRSEFTGPGGGPLEISRPGARDRLASALRRLRANGHASGAEPSAGGNGTA